MKIMQASPDVDLSGIDDKVKSILEKHVGKGAYKSRQEPVAFGINALISTFVMQEEGGKTDLIEKEVEALEGVQSVSITDVRRSIG
jgi:translation elongation factor aEF-1 beta